MSNGEHENANESENENKQESVDKAKNAVGNIISSLMALKESNPKVFFGAIAGVVVVLIFLMSGGSNKQLPVRQSKDITPGQNYVLKSSNAADPSAPIRLVSVPGSMAAYDDTEEEDRSGCKLATAGTPVKAVQTQDAYGKKDAFVQVEITSGNCQGHKGWVLAVDIQ